MLFVLVDGWTLIVGSLLESFVQEGDSSRLSATAAAAIPIFVLVRMVQKGELNPDDPDDPDDPDAMVRGAAND